MRVVLYFLIWSLRTSLCYVMANEMIMSNFIVFAKMPARNITIWGPRRDMMCVYAGPYGHTQTGDDGDGKK